MQAADTSTGKHVRCTGCQTILQVPGGSTTPSSDEWYLQTEDGQTYGPASKQELDDWLREGRVTAKTQILREGTAQWQSAVDVYPQLAAASQPAAKPGGQQNPFDFGEAKTKAAPFDYAAAGTAPAASGGGRRSAGYHGGGETYEERPPESGAVTAVAVVNFVLGTFQVLCGGFSVVGGGFITRIARMASGNRAGGVENLGTLVGGVIVAIGVFLLLFGVFILLAGFGVNQRAQWGRTMTLILGGIAGLFALINVAILVGGSPLGIIGLAVQGGYCALVFCVLLNRQYAAEFR